MKHKALGFAFAFVLIIYLIPQMHFVATYKIISLEILLLQLCNQITQCNAQIYCETLQEIQNSLLQAALYYEDVETEECQ